MQHRTILAGIDSLAGEHAFDRRRKLRLAGQIDQQPERLRRHALLGVIEENAVERQREGLGTLRVALKQVAQMNRGTSVAMGTKGRPGRGRA